MTGQNAEDRPGEGRPSIIGKRNNQSAPNIAPPVRPVNVRNLREAAIRTRVDALSDRMDSELEADRRFFARWPHRSYYVRRSFRAEAEITSLLNASDWPMTSLMNGADYPLKPGVCWFTAVGQMAPGYRARVFFLGPSNLDCCGMPDAAASRIFYALADEQLVAKTRAAVTEKRAEHRA